MVLWERLPPMATAEGLACGWVCGWVLSAHTTLEHRQAAQDCLASRWVFGTKTSKATL